MPVHAIYISTSLCKQNKDYTNSILSSMVQNKDYLSHPSQY